MKNIEIFGNTKACLQNQTNRILIETKSRSTKTHNEVKAFWGEGSGRTHRTTKAIGDQGGELDSRIEAQIQKPPRDRALRSEMGAIVDGQSDGGGEGREGRAISLLCIKVLSDMVLGYVSERRR